MRCRRGISEGKMARGICTRTELRMMESGEVSWKKMTGDYMLQRLGVPTEYFEVMADARELEGWREREDICLCIFEDQEKAQLLIEKYENKYPKKSTFEQQFLKKMQTILLMQVYAKNKKEGQEFEEKQVADGEKMLQSAREMVLCTLPVDWEQKKLSKFLLAPAELESILVLANCLLLTDQVDKAVQLHQQVELYLKEKKLEPKVQLLINPQMALLGMKLSMQTGDDEKAFQYGKKALELLRHQYSQRYAVFVLEELLQVLDHILKNDKDTKEKQQTKKREYEDYRDKVKEFLEMFRTLYGLFSYPQKRMWQSIIVSNTHEIGLTLKMLRKALSLSTAKVSSANPDHLTARQIEKIEAGTHRPTVRNYQKLMQFYHRTGLEGQLLLETESLEVLHQRQEIVDFIIREEWDRAWESFQSFKGKLNMDVPANQQEVLSLEADIQNKRGNLSASMYMEMMKKALHYTMPKIPMEKWNMWVFQREEGVIAGNIANLLEASGEREQAEKLCKILIQSFEKQMQLTKIPYRGYTIVSEGLQNVLGNLGKYEEALQQDKKTIEVLLNDSSIDPLDYPLYDLCWCLYEMDHGVKMSEDKTENQYGIYFKICYHLAEFCYKKEMVQFLEERRIKYLDMNRR